MFKRHPRPSAKVVVGGGAWGSPACRSHARRPRRGGGAKEGKRRLAVLVGLQRGLWQQWVRGGCRRALVGKPRPTRLSPAPRERGRSVGLRRPG